MHRKLRALFISIPVILSNWVAFLKLILNFVENKSSEKYCLSKAPLTFINLKDLLPNLHETIIDYSYLDSTSYPIDIALLIGMVKRYKECNYLEIGSYRGESLINIIPFAKSVTSISLSKQQMAEFGISADFIAVEGCLIPPQSHYKQIYANSLSFNFKSLHEKFDVIFIDGDHSTHAVKIDTVNALQLLKDDDSVIIWHDCGYTVNDFRYDVLEGILRGVKEDNHKYIYRIQNTLCCIYTKSPILYSNGKNINLPQSLFDINIKIKDSHVLDKINM